MSVACLSTVSYYLYYVMPSVRPSVCPSSQTSVCLSVNCLCLLHNFDTVQDIFMKLSTNINHHQTMCREQEPKLHLYFLQNYGPLKFFLWKSCPLYNFDTVQNIFMKRCRNINHHQTICREQESWLHLHFLRNYAPSKFLVWKSCPLYKFYTIKNILKLCTNINHHQTMCREQEPNPLIFFTELCPFEIFAMKIMSPL